MSREGLIESVRRIADTTVAEHAADVDRKRRFPRESLRSLADAGLWGLTVPAELGGLGAGMADFAGAVEQVARVCGSTGMVYVMHVCGAMSIAGAGSAEQKKRWLPGIASGKTLATLAFSEPGSGSHFYYPISKAVAAGDGWRLTAEKSFATSAGEADLYVVSTGSAEGNAPAESDLFLVPAGAAGLSVHGRWEGMGFNGNCSAPMSFSNVAVGAGDRLGAAKSGMGTMLGVILPWFQMGVAAVNLGLARGAMDLAIGHVKGRKYDFSGSRLADISSVQHAVAEMSMAVESARAFLMQTAAAVDAGRPDVLPAVLQVKAVATRAALEVTATAMRVCGGAAFARQLPVERFFRDAQAGAVMAPTTDVLKEFVGKALLGIPLF